MGIGFKNNKTRKDKFKRNWIYDTGHGVYLYNQYNLFSWNFQNSPLLNVKVES